MLNILEVSCASKSYGLKHEKEIVFKNLNISVPIGSIYCLLGSSGCGKTTLISCMMGVKSLDSGSIKVFNESISTEQQQKSINRIGYMPQEISLSPIMTVMETLKFFANISQMDMTLFKNRYKLIEETLEIPKSKNLIENLSGGEKRRVSLAVALIHDPEFLICDEPTVGLDIIISTKIWDFLKQSTKSARPLTIFMTTHYPHEAEKSDICGFMRNGKIVAEASPKNIMESLNVETLDEATLELCYRKYKEENLHTVFNDKMDDCSSMTYSLNKRKNRKFFEQQTLLGLIAKKYQWFKRTKMLTSAVFFVPILLFYMMCLTFGRPIKNIRIGIHNSESTNCSELLGSSLTFDCKSQKLSCLFIDKISNDIFDKRIFETFDEAFTEGKKGNFVLAIPENFSVDFLESSQESYIKIYMDHSNIFKYNFAKLGIIKAYNDFIKNITPKCNESLIYYQNQMIFKDLKEENIESNFDTSSFAAAMYLVSVLMSSTMTLAFSINQYKHEGIWNRILLSGVNQYQLLIAEIILSIILALLHVIQSIIPLYLHRDLTYINDYFSLFGAIALTSLVGSMIGNIGAILCDNFSSLSSAGCTVFLLLFFSSGALSPYESMLKYFQLFMKILPSGIPTMSFKNILLKGLTITHETVYNGFILMIFWIILLFVISMIALRNRKFI